MNEMTHTSGPWQLTSIPFELKNTDSAASIYGPYHLNNGACLIADVSRSPGDGQADANAKLIAAAPEMYEIINGLDISEIRNTSPQFADQIETLLTRINSK